MQQHAIPEASMPQNEDQDDLRLQVEQIIAQRLERSSLKKPKATEMPKPASAETPSLRKTAKRGVIDPFEMDDDIFGEALSDDTFLDAMSAEIAPQFEEANPALSETFVPQDELPPLSAAATEPRREERRKGERRNMEFLRTEVQWSTPGEDDKKPSLFSGLSGFKPSRIMMLAIASVSAAVAVAMTLAGSPAPEPVVEEPVVAEAPLVPTARILVAAGAIGAGERVEASSLAWHEVPEGDVLPEYVAEQTDIDVMANTDGSVARFPFFPGDPIRTDKLLTNAQLSLAMTLTPGMRGVSVVVTPEAAAGGFIKPDDRVDVVMTNAGKTNTVLRDVRVLAINARLGPSSTGEVPVDVEEESKTFDGLARATLELDPQSAEVLVNAAATGSLTLTLRADSDASNPGSSKLSGADQAIRMTSPFWADGRPPGS